MLRGGEIQEKREVAIGIIQRVFQKKDRPSREYNLGGMQPRGGNRVSGEKGERKS